MVVAIRILNKNKAGGKQSVRLRWHDVVGVWASSACSLGRLPVELTLAHVRELTPSGVKAKDGYMASSYHYWLYGRGRTTLNSMLGKFGSERPNVVIGDVHHGAQVFLQSSKGEIIVVTPVDKGVFHVKHSRLLWGENDDRAEFIMPYDRSELRRLNGLGAIHFEDTEHSTIPVQIDCTDKHCDYVEEVLRLMSFLRTNFKVSGALRLIVFEDEETSEVEAKVTLSLHDRLITHVLPGPRQCRTIGDWEKALNDMGKAFGKVANMDGHYINSWLEALGPFDEDPVWPADASVLFYEMWQEMAEKFFSVGGSLQDWTALETLVKPMVNWGIKPLGFRGEVRPGRHTSAFVSYQHNVNMYYSGYITKVYREVVYAEPLQTFDSIQEAIEAVSIPTELNRWGIFWRSNARVTILSLSKRSVVPHLDDLMDLFGFVTAEKEGHTEIRLRLTGETLLDRHLQGSDQPDHRLELSLPTGPIADDFWSEWVEKNLGSDCKDRFLTWWESRDRRRSSEEQICESLDSDDDTEEDSGDSEPQRKRVKR